MNEREKYVRAARRRISDQRLVAFLLAAHEMRGGCVTAVQAICNELQRGKSLDEIFYTGDDFGYSLSVAKSGKAWKISFGCQANPLAGDGAEWLVSFDGDKVQSISADGWWIS